MIDFWRTTVGLISVCLLTVFSVDVPVVAAPIPPLLMGQNTERFSEQLSQESIQKVLDRMEQAREEENVEGVLKYIAPFAHSTISVEIDDDMIILTLNGIAEHRDFLAETYQEVKERKILDRQVDIRLSPGGKMGIAIITEAVEFTTEEGENFLSESVDTLRFGLVNGQPMVVSATLKGWLALTPSSPSRN